MPAKLQTGFCKKTPRYHVDTSLFGHSPTINVWHPCGFAKHIFSKIFLSGAFFSHLGLSTGTLTKVFYCGGLFFVGKDPVNWWQWWSPTVWVKRDVSVQMVYCRLASFVNYVGQIILWTNFEKLFLLCMVFGDWYWLYDWKINECEM